LLMLKQISALFFALCQFWAPSVTDAPRQGLVQLKVGDVTQR